MNSKRCRILTYLLMSTSITWSNIWAGESNEYLYDTTTETLVVINSNQFTNALDTAKAQKLPISGARHLDDHITNTLLNEFGDVESIFYVKDGSERPISIYILRNENFDDFNDESFDIKYINDSRELNLKQQDFNVYNGTLIINSKLDVEQLEQLELYNVPITNNQSENYIYIHKNDKTSIIKL